MSKFDRVLKVVGTVASAVPTFVDIASAFVQQLRASKTRKPDQAPGNCQYYMDSVCPDDCPCKPHTVSTS